MPGVSISTSVRTGPSSETVRASSQAFFVGLAERGPSGSAVKVNSLAEFQQVFGGYVSYAYLHPTVQSFFEEGGTQAYIVRVVGPAATSGELALLNSSTTVITLDAVGAGSWSADLEAQVVASGSKRNLRLYYNNELIYSTGLKSSNAEIVSAVNGSSIASKYVTATLNDATLVSAVGQTALSAGDDDRDDNSVDTTFQAFVDALDLFLDSYGPGAIACPETFGIDAELIAHANAYSRIALLFADSEESDFATLTSALESEDGAEHAAMYHPWVYIPTDVTGINKMIPPVGYVAGKRALAHNQTGPHRPYAGLVSAATFVNGVSADIGKAEGDELDALGVNAIRVIANQVRVYGARSLSTDVSNFRFITAQDVINSIVFAANASMEDLLFSVIDSRGGLFGEITGRLKAICENMKTLGALYEGFNENGVLVDPGYVVKCDSSINSNASLAEGIVTAQLGVRVSSIGDTINVTIVKSNLTSSVTI